MNNWEKVEETPAAPAPQPIPLCSNLSPRPLHQSLRSSHPAPPPAQRIQFPLALAGLRRILAAVCGCRRFFCHSKNIEAAEVDGDSVIMPSSISLPSGDMILIPSGPALLGEQNQSQPIRAFYIDKTEVSTRAYLDFCQKTRHTAPPDISLIDGDLPIRNVSYADASAFAAWAHKRLPTAAEWEKAARGTQGQHFPWGNDIGIGMARLPITPEDAATNAQPQAVPSPIDAFPSGASSYGVLNMVGNVWEWGS